MYMSGLDELDRKILDLLTQNARYSYSELGERLGLSRVAIKNRMDALEQRGVIEGYTVIVNPQRANGAISCYYEIEARPDALAEVVRLLDACPTVTQIYRMTGTASARYRVTNALSGHTLSSSCSIAGTSGSSCISQTSCVSAA